MPAPRGSSRPALSLLIAGLVLDGIAAGPLKPFILMVTIRHERIFPAMRGGVFATYSANSQVVSRLGMVRTGLDEVNDQRTQLSYAQSRKSKSLVVVED